MLKKHVAFAVVLLCGCHHGRRDVHVVDLGPSNDASGNVDAGEDFSFVPSEAGIPGDMTDLAPNLQTCAGANAARSSVGCEYYAVEPFFLPASGPWCFAAYIANTDPNPATITVDRAGTSFNLADFARIPSGSGGAITYAALPGGQLPSGQIAILFLGGGTGCPSGVSPPVPGDPTVQGSAIGQAFHITTSVPVVAYDIFPYGGGSSMVTSATLLLPTSVWDVNYIAVNAYPQSQLGGADGSTPTLFIVAEQDATNVSIKPVVAILAGSAVAGAAAGSTATYALNKGEYLQLAQPAELTGSPILADKPVGVWGGANQLNVPVANASADTAHQQIPPVQAMGSEYVAIRYRNRSDTIEEIPPWRLVGAVDGTTLSYAPSAPVGAPTTLNQGQVAEFDSSGQFVVTSQDAQHPFYAAGYMTGSQIICPTTEGCAGDPEFVNIVPADQFLSSYVFFTDPTYPETDLTIVRKSQSGVFADVTLDCAGVLTGWTAIANSDYQWTRIDLVRHNFAPQGTCNNGRHTISSSTPFGVTVWGWGTAETGYSPPEGTTGITTTAVSYAYPAGAGVKHINTVIVPVK